MNPDQVQGRSDRQKENKELWQMAPGLFFCVCVLLMKTDQALAKGCFRLAVHAISTLKSESISKQLSLCPFQRLSLIGQTPRLLQPIAFRQHGSRGLYTREGV